MGKVRFGKLLCLLGMRRINVSKWSSARASWRLLGRREQRYMVVVTAAQALLALLDLIGTALLGLVAGLGVVAMGGQVPQLLDPIWSRINSGSRNTTTVLLVLAVLAGTLLISKSITSMLINRRIFQFLASRQAVVANRLASDVMSRSLLEIQARPSQELTYALTTGVAAAMNGVLGSASIILSEGFLILIFVLGLAAVDLGVTLVSLIFFGLVALALHRYVTGWASRLGVANKSTTVDSLTVVQDATRTYRELWVSGRRVFFLHKFNGLRTEAASVAAEIDILGQLPKYVFEIALIVGGGILAAASLATRDAAAGVSVVAVFFVAASRVMPSLLRLQGAVLVIGTNTGVARPTLMLASDLLLTQGQRVTDDTLSEVMRGRVVDHLRSGFRDFDGRVDVRDVALRYPGARTPALRGVTFEVAAGTSLALVGPTGAGKSSLADVILGLLNPDEGAVLIGGLSPSEAIRLEPGAISYVPQEISVVRGTVRDNVALSLNYSDYSEEDLWEALERAHLATDLRNLRDGLDTEVGEHGVQLSGGQRQRLGLARALFTRPKLIVLDEATSALDAETEASIANTLRSFEGDVTTIVVAHRLATIRHCDQVAYMEGGSVVAIGSFDEVRKRVPNFDSQAQLLGL
jgi:ABC-type multidrug transport system fused ATPase/permease subunit